MFASVGRRLALLNAVIVIAVIALVGLGTTLILRAALEREESSLLERRAESAAYRQVRREHNKVERKLSDVIRNHAGRRVRYRGLARVRGQYLVAALVVNAKRVVKLLFGPPPAAWAEG